jgi:hypothetical protein
MASAISSRTSRAIATLAVISASAAARPSPAATRLGTLAW